MKSLFCAESVAIIGVSESRINMGRYVLKNMVRFGYQGKIYAIGTRGGEVYDHRIYRTVGKVPDDIELAVIVAPARYVKELLIQCGKKGIKWVIIESGGFSESGSKGEPLEKEIIQASEEYGIRFVGPNCLGAVNPAIGLCTPFVDYSYPFKSGSVAVVSQSGGFGNCFSDRAAASGLGISKLISMGNKLSVDESDYLAYLMDDPDTDVIYFYLEDIKRCRLFADLALKSSKPIILHKSNTSHLSGNIAQSHTAALAVDDQVLDAVCTDSGILRVRSTSEALIAARGFSLPVLKGRRLAVLSRSGGYAVVSADACARYGFQLPAFGPDVIDAVRKNSRAGVIKAGNPLDLGDVYDLTAYFDIVEKCLRQEDIDGVVFSVVSQMNFEKKGILAFLEWIPSLSVKYQKPVALAVDFPMKECVGLEDILNFPFFLEPAEAIEALAIQYGRNRFVESIRKGQEPGEMTLPLTRIKDWFGDMKRKKRQPSLHEALDLLDRISVPTIPWRMAGNLDQALAWAGELGFPVALKAVAPSLSHKSDKGGVALNVRDEESLRTEWKRLQTISNDIEGIVLQRMAPAAREIIVGGKRDPSFGPVVLVGLGGIMVEVIKDVRMRLAPVDANTALKMLEELSGARLFGPFRGMRKADIEAAARIVATVSLVMHHFPEISELDLNPVGLNDDGVGAVALDARVLLHKS